MGSYEKMRDRIMRTPTVVDITPAEIKSFLEHYGFKLKRSKGSHFIYEYPNSAKSFILNIPMHNPIKPTYIDDIRNRIIEIEENYE